MIQRFWLVFDNLLTSFWKHFHDGFHVKLVNKNWRTVKGWSSQVSFSFSRLCPLYFLVLTTQLKLKPSNVVKKLSKRTKGTSSDWLFSSVVPSLLTARWDVNKDGYEGKVSFCLCSIVRSKICSNFRCFYEQGLYSVTYNYLRGQVMSVLHSSIVFGLTACTHWRSETDTSIPCAFSFIHFKVRVLFPPSHDREHWKQDKIEIVKNRAGKILENHVIIFLLVKESGSSLVSYPIAENSAFTVNTHLTPG